jgi:hypothetical protein
MDTITAQLVPWSSVVGQMVSLHDETGRVICTLSIRNVVAEDLRSASHDIARFVVNTINEAGKK